MVSIIHVTGNIRHIKKLQLQLQYDNAETQAYTEQVLIEPNVLHCLKHFDRATPTIVLIN